MMTLPLLPVWTVDFVGSLLMIVVSSMCLGVARQIYHRDPENALANYLLGFTVAIFAFSVSRSLGHIIKHVLYFAGYSHWWQSLSPISGSINTITFVIIASITLYFRRTETIMARMARDKDKIATFSRELLALNRDIETIVAERTRTETTLLVSHGVRNPAMIIGGMARKIKKSGPENSAINRYIDTIVSETKKLEALVEELGKSSDSSDKKFTSVDLNEIVTTSVEAMQGEAQEKEIVLADDYHPAPLIFVGSKYLVNIAIIHLLRNAIGACSKGDRIDIITRPGEKSVSVVVRDNGPGIAPEIVEHIFDPFYQTKKGSTGIGLPYIKQIVEEQKGSISLTSKLGEGTSVEISLPPLLGELSRSKGD